MVLSEEDDKRSRGVVEGTSSDSEPSIEGEKDTLYTGAECPMSRREPDGGVFGVGATTDGRGSPWRCHTRM